MTRFFSRSYIVPAVVLLSGAAVLSGLLIPFLSIERLLGWDLYAHYYLVERMAENLRNGVIFSYDPKWFAGYPIFTFYGPLPYILVAGLSILSFESVSIALALNIFSFSLPFAFLLAIFYACKQYFNSASAVFGVLYALFFLTFGEGDQLGNDGIFGALFHGHTAGFFATVVLIFLLGSLEVLRLTFTWKRFIICVALLSAIVLSHAITTLFSVLVILLHGIFGGRKHLLRVLALFLVSFLCTAFYVLPFVAQLQFTSSVTIGIQKDPLLSLFPDLGSIKRCIAGIPSHFMIGALLCSMLPFCGFLFGCLHLIRTKAYFLPFTVIFCLLILSRNFLSEILPLEIHYYRFVLPLFPLVTVISAGGSSALFRSIGLWRARSGRWFGQVGVAALHGWALICCGLQYYPEAPWSQIQRTALFQSSRFACDKRPVATPPLYESESAAIDGAKKVATFLTQIMPTGLIGVETRVNRTFSIPTPHFLATYLALNTDLRTSSGLLAESSYSAGFLIPVFGHLTNSLVWGRDNIWPYIQGKPDLTSILRRLTLFGVEYVVVSYKEFASDYVTRSGGEVGAEGGLTAYQPQSSDPSLNFVVSLYPFHIFKVINTRPPIEGISYRPFLYIERGGESFREFSELWFQYDSILRYPVIFTPQSYMSLSERERESIGGIILAYQAGSIISRDELSRWSSTGKKLIVVNGIVPREVERDAVQATFLSNLNHENFIVRLENEIADRDAQSSGIVAETNSGSTIAFEHHGGVIIRRSFFPWWKSENTHQTVFLVTPSLLYVVADGKVELTFKVPSLFQTVLDFGNQVLSSEK